MVKLVVSDMDGTLVNSKDELPVDLFHRILQLKEKGVLFAIASGRQYWNILKRFEPIKDDVIFIAENGGMIFDQGECIYSDKIDESDIIEFINLFEEHSNIYVILCGLNSAYTMTKDQNFLEHIQKYYERVEVVDDLIEVTKRDTICKIAVYNEESSEKVIAPLLKSYEDRFMLAVSGNFWLDVMKKGIDKGNGIRRIQKQYDILPEESMAFGDYLNDYEMMQVCEYSYAMENAHPKLKEICKYQTESNEECGVVKELVRFFELED